MGSLRLYAPFQPLEPELTGDSSVVLVLAVYYNNIQVFAHGLGLLQRARLVSLRSFSSSRM